MTNTDKERELASLRRQLAEARENLRIIRERKSEYVIGTDVPLQWTKDERRLERAIADLEATVGVLEQEFAALEAVEREDEVDQQMASPIATVSALGQQSAIQDAKDTERATPKQAPSVPELPLDVPITASVPAGPFWMGSALDDSSAHGNEKPRRVLDLPAYRIGRYPVINAQYACFVLATACAPPGHWEDGNAPAGFEDHPVVGVSYRDAKAYCRWLSEVTDQRFCLPTEEEWEKAARGGVSETRRYPWGDEWQADACNTRELGRKATTPVREFEGTNVSPFGVVDMMGNVWEWTASWYERYPGSTHEGRNYGRTHKVVRGGTWRSEPKDIRISRRGRYEPGIQRRYLGFRVVSLASVQMIGPTLMDEGEGVQYRFKLCREIATHFSIEELRDLCIELGMDYEDIPDRKDAVVEELVLHVERRGCISEFAETCRRLRPEDFQ